MSNLNAALNKLRANTKEVEALMAKVNNKNKAALNAPTPAAAVPPMQEAVAAGNKINQIAVSSQQTAVNAGIPVSNPNVQTQANAAMKAANKNAVTANKLVAKAVVANTVRLS